MSIKNGLLKFLAVPVVTIGVLGAIATYFKADIEAFFAKGNAQELLVQAPASTTISQPVPSVESLAGFDYTKDRTWKHQPMIKTYLSNLEHDKLPQHQIALQHLQESNLYFSGADFVRRGRRLDALVANPALRNAATVIFGAIEPSLKQQYMRSKVANAETSEAAPQANAQKKSKVKFASFKPAAKEGVNQQATAKVTGKQDKAPAATPAVHYLPSYKIYRSGRRASAYTPSFLASDGAAARYFTRYHKLDQAAGSLSVDFANYLTEQLKAPAARDYIQYRYADANDLPKTTIYLQKSAQEFVAKVAEGFGDVLVEKYRLSSLPARQVRSTLTQYLTSCNQELEVCGVNLLTAVELEFIQGQLAAEYRFLSSLQTKLVQKIKQEANTHRWESKGFNAQLAYNLRLLSQRRAQFWELDMDVRQKYQDAEVASLVPTALAQQYAKYRPAVLSGIEKRLVAEETNGEVTYRLTATTSKRTTKRR